MDHPAGIRRRPGGPPNLAVRFLLAGFFWGILALLARSQWRREGERRDLWICLAALAGLTRELFLPVCEDLALRGLLSRQFPFLQHPPSNMP